MKRTTQTEASGTVVGARMPDFLIVGAPKCGTTYLDGVLAQHPRIHQAKKELHHFGSDLELNHRHRSLAKYLLQFKDAAPDQVCGETSVYYLYSRRAAEEIREACPSARIIIMLRNPVHMVESLHAQLLFTGNETIRDLREALRAEPDRREGRRIPPRCRRPSALLYREVADFAPQVQRYLELFGEERVHIILFDDLKAAPEGVVDDTLRFLGLEPHPGWGRESRNPRHSVRYPFLQRLIRRPPASLKRVMRSAVPGSVRRRVARLIVGRVNQKTVPPPDLELRLELIQEFRPRVEALEEVIGRSLSAWKT